MAPVNPKQGTQQHKLENPVELVDADTDNGIVNTVQGMLQSTQARQADWHAEERWSDKTKRLFAVALVLYRTRLVDLRQRTGPHSVAN